jgi:protein SCO1
MLKIFTMIILLSLLPLLIIKTLKADEQIPEVGIVPKLGDTIPLDIHFIDSDGQIVLMKDLINKPTILTLVYYHCPGVCSPMLTNLSAVIDNMGLTAGVDFNALSISFDHHETPQISAKWKKNYFSTLKHTIDLNTWRFMTGDSADIRRLSNSVGFYFKPDGVDDYTHPAGIMIISPIGKITKYITGTEFTAGDVKLALVQAKENITTPTSYPTSNEFLTICFNYDPQKQKWVFDLTKGLGIFMLASVIVFAVIVVFRKKGGKKSTSDISELHPPDNEEKSE